MQREVHQDGLDVERLLELFNTHGTEIAPGSDVIGEDLQGDPLVHVLLLQSKRETAVDDDRLAGDHCTAGA